MAETDTEIQAVLRANDAFYAAFRNSDIDKMTALWGQEEPVAVQHPSSPHLQGRAAVLKSWGQILRAPPDITYTIEDLLEDDGQWAVICIEHIGRVNIRMVNVIRQEDGMWKFVYHGPAPRSVLGN